MLFPIAVVSFIIVSTLLDIVFVVSVNKTIAPQITLIFSYGSVVLGVWTLVVMLLASCSDPGIINPKEDSHSQDATMRAMSLNEEELKAFCNND